MARRAGWAALKEATRKRYTAGGITQREYEAGASLKKARGHENTPEHGIKVEHQKGQIYKTVQGGEVLDAPDKYRAYLTSHYPDLIKPGEPETLPTGWVSYTDSDARRAVEYAAAIGNPGYLKAWISEGGTVTLHVYRPKKST